MKMSVVRYVPNTITLLRVALCIALIFIKPVLGIASFIVFCIAGLTDMIDGPLARKIPNGKTAIGGDLDAFADMLLIVVGVFVLMPHMNVWSGLWIAVIAILVFKIVSASLTGLIKHKKILFTHTLANKLAALFLFAAPILFFIVGEKVGDGENLIVNIYIIFLFCWVFLATVEEALINLLIKVPNVNVKGIWEIKKLNDKNNDS
ncbi:MAG: CDP-alcohol phosphatidyltransferase family protein [Coriobacteriia bacterium]|nr:CDP-alcohol phosphatidyltransferase family protein [Coriobacteriia bacterium]